MHGIARPFVTQAMRQRGGALLESLVAFVFLALAALGALQMQSQIRLQGDLARQRSEAVRLGERELETLRAWSTLTPASGASAYSSIVDTDNVVDAGSGYLSNADYRIARRTDATAWTGAKLTSVAVEWIDRGGAAQRIVLDSVIAQSEPAWSGALAVGAGAGVPRGAHGRSSAIPPAAKSLGDGRSVLKPNSSGSVAVVFDDDTGTVVARCTGLDATTATRELTSSELSSCVTGRWLFLDGAVRFTSAAPPSLLDASEAPLPVNVTLALVDGSYDAAPECTAEAMKTVRYSGADGLHIDAVPLAALPASLGLASWNETGDRFVSYRCIVMPRANGRWSGRSTLVPVGWTIGTSLQDRRVCRYASDRDGSGAIDVNEEHPAQYSDVATALMAQNFLIVRGDQGCPAAADSSLLASSLGTMQHQP